MRVEPDDQARKLPLFAGFEKADKGTVSRPDGQRDGKFGQVDSVLLWESVRHVKHVRRFCNGEDCEESTGQEERQEASG